jgi:hypothetical protein
MKRLQMMVAVMLVWLGSLAKAQPVASGLPTRPAVEAVDFELRQVYRPNRKPAYSSWVSLFPGHAGEWYISFEEVYSTTPPHPRAPLDHWYAMGLPDGYDKSALGMEVVLLESKDRCASWKVLSRWPGQYQHSAGSFGAVKTCDGRFLRTVWSCYGWGGLAHPGEILYESCDGGHTWSKRPAMLDARFAAYPHRMKQLRDGTIVLAVPYEEMWGRGAARPLRTSTRIQAQNELQMSLYFSYDQGQSWQGPILILAGKPISETDFVELAGGDLLVFASSIFPSPGRQYVFRTGQSWVPGAFLRNDGQIVPETVVLAAEGMLVGSMRNGGYYWSDDEGSNWYPLAGVPQCGYQPMIRRMDDGRLICAWHRGADDAPARADQFVGLHVFRLKTNRRMAMTRLAIEREYDATQNRFLNVYQVHLTVDERPLPGKKVELWYVVRDAPGYEPFNHSPISERMQRGGKLLDARTDSSGTARFALAEFDKITDPHASYQLFARFNADRSDADFKPATTPLCEFYASHHGPR